MINTNTTKAIKLSDKYKPISDEQVLSYLNDKGFTVSSVNFARLNKNNYHLQGLQRRVYRLRHKDFTANAQGLIPEIILVNSFDGKCSWRIMLGVYRLVCSNGLIAGTTYGERRVKHIGDNVLDKVNEAINVTLNESDKYLNELKRMGEVLLSNTMQLVFFNETLKIIFKQNYDKFEVNLERQFAPRRIEDKANDLFTIFNRAQEMAVNGGVRYYDKEKGVYRTTKRLVSPSSIVSTNVQLANLAHEWLKRA